MGFVAPEATLTFAAQIEAPIWRVFQNWKRLERFPNFVPTVLEARWLAPDRLFWREEYGGQVYESTYAITLRLNENSLSWRSLSGPASTGTALCEPHPRGTTRVTLTVHFTPDEGLQSAAAIEKRHRDFLWSFKQFVEARGKGAGANTRPSPA